jgi:hypothetical protein
MLGKNVVDEEKSRCVLFQRMLTIVYLAQDGERLPTLPE